MSLPDFVQASAHAESSAFLRGGFAEQVCHVLNLRADERLTVESGDQVNHVGRCPIPFVQRWRGACVLEGSNDPIEVMAGTLDSGLRWVVVVQGDEHELFATTDHGSEITLELSPPIDRFGLRFAVAALPTGEAPGSIRVEQGGIVLETMRQWVPPRRS